MSEFNNGGAGPSKRRRNSNRNRGGKGKEKEVNPVPIQQDAPILKASSENEQIAVKFSQSKTVTEAPSKKAFITTDKFSDLPISEESKKAMKDVLKYEYMTSVQSQSIGPILKGVDCLAKAKTGTKVALFIPTSSLYAC